MRPPKSCLKSKNRHTVAGHISKAAPFRGVILLLIVSILYKCQKRLLEIMCALKSLVTLDQFSHTVLNFVGILAILGF